MLYIENSEQMVTTITKYRKFIITLEGGSLQPRCQCSQTVSKGFSFNLNLK